MMFFVCIFELIIESYKCCFRIRFDRQLLIDPPKIILKIMINKGKNKDLKNTKVALIIERLILSISLYTHFDKFQ